MKNKYQKIAKGIAAFVMVLNVLSVNSACWWHLHQPKVPEGIDRLLLSSKK